MKEIISIDETSGVNVAVSEDVKKLEDTMASSDIAPMPKLLTKEELSKRSESMMGEESLGDIVSRGMPEIDEVSATVAELSAQIDIDGVGSFKYPLDNCVGTHKVVETKPARTRVFNSGLTVIKAFNQKIPITLPSMIIRICNSLQREIGSNLEFSIVCKGHWDDGKYVVTDDYKVPKQKVAGASVDYDLEHLEELKLAGYNTVIHSHPFKSSAFSSSDDETINSHFECSVLYSIGEFTAATISVVPTPGTKLIITGEPDVEGESGIVPESEIKNIEKSYKYDYNDRWKNSHVTNDDYWYGYNDNLGSRNINGFARGEYYDRDYNKDKNWMKVGNREYDVDKDVLYVNGKPVNHPGSARRNASHLSNTHVKVHECGCGNASRVFRTEDNTSHQSCQKSSIFRSDKSKGRINNKKNR